MRTGLLLSSLALAGAAAASDTACTIPNAAAGQHDGKCQGIKYTYHVPAQCAAGTACGLILDVHGWTMNGDAQDANTGTRSLGERYSFVVVQPTAPKRNSVGAALSSSRLLSLITSWSEEDYPKVWAILESARDEVALHIDPERVHFMGFSQGSKMTWWMLQNHAEDLASVVPLSCHAGDAWTPQALSAAARTPVLYSHGYHDGLCSFHDGNATIQTLKSEWGLSASAVLSKDDHHVRTAYKGTDGQYVETLFWDYESGNWGGLGSVCGVIYKRVGDGHCFPGGSDTHCFDPKHPRVSFPERLAPFSCPAPDTKAAAFVIGEVAVQFFIDHPRKRSELTLL